MDRSGRRPLALLIAAAFALLAVGPSLADDSPDLVATRVRTGDYGGSDHKPVVADLAFAAEH